jgi:ABC-type bacteriocin/lantibiotic exporter with double-glycine peptidase domain
VFQYKVLVAFKVIVSAFLLSIGTYLVIKQQINIGEFIAAEIVILTVIGAVEKLISSLDSVYDVIAGIEKIESVTELQTEKGGTLQLENENKGISLNLIDVSYEYLPNKKAVNHINLAIPSNAKVGINGENGSGKATLIKLLATCYDNYTGQILVNGLSLSNYELKALRSNISLHVNNNDLFLGTVLQNISMGNALVDTNKILALARQLGFQDVLQQFSNGFDTVLDPAGKKLSQSTTKKLLLLRAFANQGKLIILNDPWRSLSYTDKQNIVNYINTLNNTTVIVVTTDEDYLNQCTHVLTLSKGTVLSYKTN